MRPTRITPRSARLLLLLLGPAASSCAPPGQAGETAADSAAIAPATGAPAASDWEQGVRLNLGADQYRFRPAPDGLVARNPAWRLNARFGRDGASFGAEAPDGELGLRFLAWGRAAEMMPVADASPALGDCVDGAPRDAVGACLQRLEYDRDLAVEWWINGTSGFEQGFDLAAEPAGSGPLVLEIAVEGALAEAEPDGDAVWLYADSGSTWRYSGPVAWDALGEPLAAVLEAEADLIRIVVDDEGAVWPIVVDPLLTTASWTVESSQASSEFGITVVAAGDVNDDGFDDVAVGAPKYDNGDSDEGAVFVYHGSASGLATTASWSAESGQAASWFGYGIAAGDMNGDGYGDLAIGAPQYDNPQANEGAVFVYSGSATGLGTSSRTLDTDNAGDQLGWWLAVGDFDGDGYDDVAAGAPNHSDGQTNEGGVFVYEGASSGIATNESWSQQSNQAEAALGTAVAAGNVNGDAYDDLMVGAPTYDDGSTDEGAVFVYHGASSGLATTAARTLQGDQATAYYGYRVGSGGSVNGDAYDDLVVGAILYDNGTTNEGAAFVYHGSASGLSGTASATLDNGSANSRFGRAVAIAGDIDGDGFDEVLIGAPDGGTSLEGVAYLYPGSSAGTSTTASWSSEGDQASARHGQSASGAGDVDGDGYDDVVVGTYLYDGGTTDEGRAQLYYGDVDTDGDGYPDKQDCAPTNAAIHPGATETPGNDTDENCDSSRLCYTDGDNDTYGSSVTTSTTSATCAAGGESTLSTDCDDASSAVKPGATETPGNNTDENCDGSRMCYTDADNDAYGISTTTTTTASTCVAGGESTVSTDCDDSTATISPGSTETIGNNIDENCDTLILCYTDADNDAYGASATSTTSSASCAAGGESTLSTDCDDTSSAVKPGATETAGNDVDENCDSSRLCYTDADNDAYGTTTTVATSAATCSAGSESTRSTDCDDASSSVNPGATETAGNDTDENCDSSRLCYTDADNDAYGTTSTTATTAATCAAGGEATRSTDCNDSSASINPAATETIGNDTDENCDSALLCYTDGDNDSYGATSTTSTSAATCAAGGEATRSLDCNDASATVNPAATESAGNDVDENCDSALLCYSDVDNDTYGTTATATTTSSTCVLGSEATRSTDCDDADAGDYPGATETVGNQDDEDCDGKEVCYTDSDADKYGATATKASTDTDCIDATEATVSTDCDDASASDYPGATEVVGNEDDEDCDGKEICYTDADGDLYGTTTTRSSTDTDCKDTSEATVTTDCDDAVKSTYPGAAETCGDGVDSSCDGVGGGPTADDDADGVSFDKESASGADDCDNDTDGDGILDGDEFGTGAAARDTDSDGTPDIRDSDDDGDTLATSAESTSDTDGDGKKDYLDSDDDGDTLLTSAEVSRGDTDRDGKLDHLDDDDDDDGIGTKSEVAYGTEHLDADSDGDGVNDGAEWGSGAAPRDSDGDTLIDPLDGDDDDDGIPTLDEGSEDIDGDPANGCELAADGLGNHIDTDSDGDGTPDATEYLDSDIDLDDDGVPNWLDCNDGDGCDGDADNDGLGNCVERDELGTNPSRKDSDGDGVEDGIEVDDASNPLDTDEDDIIDALDPDDDGDGLSTASELGRGDTDSDTILDYRDPDDDGDGTPTAEEDTNGNGNWFDDDLDGDEIPDFLDAIDDRFADDDGDGLQNLIEETITFTDPTRSDTDGDGIPDGAEVGPVAEEVWDTDEDGDNDANDDDDDGDGIPTDDEGSFDTDGDGTPNHLDLDADGDGLPDAEESLEDPDCDGAPEFLDADETDGPCLQSNAGGDTDLIAGGDGCGCAARPTASSAWLGLLALAGIRLRRRQR